MGSRPGAVDPSFPGPSTKGLAAALALLVLAAQPARAEAVSQADYAAVNRDLVVSHALPRFATLAKATTALDTAAEALCRAPSKAALEATKAHFHTAMDAWMGVQHLRFGPAELFSRFERIYFWPQARGKIAAAVDKLIVAEAIPSPDHMTTASAAIQGLPTLEHLLFDRGTALLRTDAAGRRHCAVLRAVTANIKAIGEGLAADWAGGRVDFRRVVTSPGPDNLFYKRHDEAALAFFQSLHDGLEAIVATRLKPVLGAKVTDDRPRLAESRSSGRSTRNIVASLTALAALYDGGGKKGFSTLVAKKGDKKLDKLMYRAFRLTLENAGSIGRPLDLAVRDEALRPRVAKLHLQLRALKQIVRTRLASAIGLQVGFNALDGD